MAKTNRTSPGSLRIFEAAARHANFTAAARELHSTQSAVSQRIHGLEQQLGLHLFDRVHRGVRLTGAGRALFVSVRDGFATIDRTIAQLQQNRSQPHLNILTDFAFAAYWLLPRLPLFRQQEPDIDVQIITDQGIADWRDRDIDVAIVFCDEDELRSVPCLFAEQVLPVCNPGFIEQNGPITDMQVLSEMPLLSLTADGQPKWLDWPGYFLRQAGLSYIAPPQLAFNNYTLLIQAAIAGQGVALGWRGLVEEQLHSRMLVGLHDMRLDTDCGYGLIDGRPNVASREKTALCRWLVDSAGQARDWE